MARAEQLLHSTPFGGALFCEAVRRLTGSFLNAVTGVPELRGTIERLFLTFELKWARYRPGWTAGSVAQLNERKPYFEACMSAAFGRPFSIHASYRMKISWYGDVGSWYRGVGKFVFRVSKNLSSS
ncbi:hypothetical protein ACSSV4_000053 [Roseovarius sp. MBR-154]|jgi:hypothetical protein